MNQPDLFAPSEASESAGSKRQEALVTGFRLTPDYLKEAEEKFFLEQIQAGPWQNDYRRAIQQYGLGYGGGERGKGPVWVRDFPDWLAELAQRVGRDAGFDRFPENCVINEYLPPQGIAPHKDYADFGPTIACVSLGSDVVMDLKHSANELRLAVHVPARSLWVMTGPARSEWQHGIAPRLSDIINGEKRMRQRRVSVTFRTGRNPVRLAGANAPAVTT
jgi:alkylated DNA repair dioxygenase AlkB